MTIEPPRPAPPAPGAVAQALAFLLKAMEDSEPAGDKDGHDIESKMTHFNILASRRRVAAEALQLAAQTEAALFDRQRNALLPIHRLPSELLSAILIKSVDEKRIPRTEALQVLAQVAWQWWQTIKSDPQFWTHIDIMPSSMGGIELQIRKAGILPLSLNWPTIADIEEDDAVKDLLQRHAGRWTSVVVGNYRGYVALQVLCTSSFPRLQFLKVHRTPPIMSGVWNFDLTKFQNLQEARLPILPSFSASPTSNSPILLQTLHLDLYSRHYHSSYDLESLLRYIPQLIELEVENLYDDTSPPSLVDTPIISLPMLRRLRFSNVVPGERRNEIPLLAQIRAPLLEEFDLHYHASTSSVPAIDIGGRAIFDALVTRPRALLSQSEEAPLYSTLRNAGPSVSWIVNVSRGKVWITAEGIGAGRLEIHCATKNDIPRYILQLLATFTLPVDLDLGLCDEDTKFAPWDEVLDATPLLQSFALDCPFEVAQQVMDLLSTKAPPPRSTNPRAPHLENLSYRFKYYSAGSWSEDDVGVAVEAMLNKRSDLFTQGGVLDPPKLVVTGPNGLVFDEVEGRWLDSKDVTRRL